MSAQHTPGPWSIRGEAADEDGEPAFFSINAGKLPNIVEIANTGNGNFRTTTERANANRIALCVNACEGISSEMLEQIGQLVGAMVPYHVLKLQHAELLAALQEAVSAVQTFHGPEAWEAYRDHSPEMKRWRAVIAKATGSAA